jgi:hypothetical protein
MQIVAHIASLVSLLAIAAVVLAHSIVGRLGGKTNSI